MLSIPSRQRAREASGAGLPCSVVHQRGARWVHAACEATARMCEHTLTKGACAIFASRRAISVLPENQVKGLVSEQAERGWGGAGRRGGGQLWPQHARAGRRGRCVRLKRQGRAAPAPLTHRRQWARPSGCSWGRCPPAAPAAPTCASSGCGRPQPPPSWPPPGR